jgi:hypothetical protein
VAVSGARCYCAAAMESGGNEGRVEWEKAALGMVGAGRRGPQQPRAGRCRHALATRRGSPDAVERVRTRARGGDDGARAWAGPR